MARTWHEYEAPLDTSVHWHKLIDELRAGACTTVTLSLVSCEGCKSFLESKAWYRPVHPGSPEAESMREMQRAIRAAEQMRAELDKANGKAAEALRLTEAAEKMADLAKRGEAMARADLDAAKASLSIVERELETLREAGRMQDAQFERMRSWANAAVSEFELFKEQLHMLLCLAKIRSGVPMDPKVFKRIELYEACARSSHEDIRDLATLIREFNQ